MLVLQEAKDNQRYFSLLKIIYVCKTQVPREFEAYLIIRITINYLIKTVIKVQIKSSYFYHWIAI